MVLWVFGVCFLLGSFEDRFCRGSLVLGIGIVVELGVCIFILV